MEAEHGLADGVQQAGFVQHVHGVGQQALADNEAGEVLLFQHADVETLFVEQRGGHRSGRPRADNHDIIDKCGHCVSRWCVVAFGVYNKAYGRMPGRMP